MSKILSITKTDFVDAWFIFNIVVEVPDDFKIEELTELLTNNEIFESYLNHRYGLIGWKKSEITSPSDKKVYTRYETESGKFLYQDDDFKLWALRHFYKEIECTQILLSDYGL